MTSGPIAGTIVRFAVPVFFGNMFQQLYNAVDSLIVGNFVGGDALAAVSSSGSLIFLFTGLIQGIFIGAGVVIARYFGAREPDKVQKAVHTTMAFAVLSGLIMVAAGILLTPWILRLMGTPDSVLPNSILYFRIYFAGFLSVVVYNAVSGIMQAVGDSRHPLYYLIISSLLNVALDLLFVAYFRWGIAGAGAATVISQTVSASLGFIRLVRSDTEVRIFPAKIRLDMPMLKNIMRIGMPSGLQNSIISLANVVVQSNINAFGAMAMAGCGSYAKVEGFAFPPVTSFTMAITTFVSQNLGAKEYSRARKGAGFGILACITIAELIGITINILSPKLVAMFNADPEVVRFGVTMARTTTLFYCLMAYSHCMAAVMRGCGRSMVPMIVMLVCWCVIRVTYITVTVHFIPDIRVVYWAYPITWALSTIVYSAYYLRTKPLNEHAA